MRPQPRRRQSPRRSRPTRAARLRRRSPSALRRGSGSWSRLSPPVRAGGLEGKQARRDEQEAGPPGALDQAEDSREAEDEREDRPPERAHSVAGAEEESVRARGHSIA